MAEAEDRLDFCKQALGELGTRSTITSLDPPDSSQEAYYCNLFFEGTRDQILRAALWNFAGRSDTLALWKAAPGTPENPTVPVGYQWNNRYPAQPYLYSYLHAAGSIVQIRRLRGQALAEEYSLIAYDQHGCAQFEVASDVTDRLGNGLNTTTTISDVVVPIVSAGTGYQGQDSITLTRSGAVYGQPPTLRVIKTNTAGAVLTALVEDGGTFVVEGAGSLTQSATTGVGSGFTCTATFGPHPAVAKVILTNVRNPIIDFTAGDVTVAQYDSLFGDAFMLALEGKLALALLGDRAIYTAKLQEANMAIINARVRDGNEGLTRYEHVPDWLQARGVSSMSAPTSGWYNPPYGPLFAV